MHEDFRVCTLYAEGKAQGAQDSEFTDHGHALDSFHLPRWQLWLPLHVVILEHAQAKRDQGVIGLQCLSVNEGNGDALGRVLDRFDNGIEQYLVGGKE